MSFDYLQCVAHDKLPEKDQLPIREQWSIKETQEYMNYCQNKLVNLARLKNQTSEYDTFGCIEARKNKSNPFTTTKVKYLCLRKEMFVKINNDQLIHELLSAVCKRFDKDPSKCELIYNYNTLSGNDSISIFESNYPLYLVDI